MKSKTFRSLAATLALLAVWMAQPVPQAALADEDRLVDVMMRVDVDSSSVAYCNVGPILNGPGQVTTSGSATAVTSAAAFGDLDIDDIIIVKRPLTTGVPDIRRLTANPATLSSLTVDVAVDWTGGFAWSYRKQTCGTTASDGWVDVTGKSAKRFEVNFEQGDIDGLDWKVQCRSSPVGGPQNVYPGIATSCGSDGASVVSGGYCRFANAVKGTEAGRFSVRDDLPWQACRIGFKYQSTDASDAGANLEIVNASVTTSDIRR